MHVLKVIPYTYNYTPPTSSPPLSLSLTGSGGVSDGAVSEVKERHSSSRRTGEAAGEPHGRRGW